MATRTLSDSRRPPGGRKRSERLRLETELRDSEERFRRLVEVSPDAVFVAIDGRIVFTNAAAFRLLGAGPPDLLVGKPLLDFVHPDDRESFARKMRGITEEGPLLSPSHGRFLRIDGAAVEVETVGAPLPWEGRGAAKVIVRDVTHRTLVEQRLQASERQLREAQRAGRVGSWEWDLRTKQVTWSDELYRMFGLRREEFSHDYQGFIERVHPQDRDEVDRAVQSALSDGQPFAYECRIVRPDGSVRAHYARGELVADPQGRPARLIGIGQDITERVRTEERLRTSERQLLEAQRVGQVGSWEWDFAADTFAWSDEFFRILGLEPGSVPPQHDAFMERAHPEDRAAIQGLRERLRQDPSPFTYECRVLRPDGSLRVLHIRGEVIRDGAARPMRLVGICQDITERRQAEAERARHAAQLQALARASLVVNSSATLEEVTRIVTEAAREIIGAHMSVTSFTIDQRWAQAIDARSLSDKYAAFKDYNPRPDGSGIYRLVCQTNRPMRLTQAELEAHPDFRRYGAEGGRHPVLRGWLAAPLVARDGRNLGLVQLADKYDGEFTADDEAILVQLAQLGSVAMENVRLLQQVTEGQERLRALSRRLVELQEWERRRIARELHDEVGQILTGLKLMLESGDPAVRPGELSRIADDLLGRVRNLSMDLRPPMLDDLGLVAALLWHFERYTAQTSVRVAFRHAGVDRRFPLEIELAAFRVVQEALTNVARHAGVPEVQVRLWTEDGRLGVLVEDRGPGFDVGKALTGPSVGLQGLRERVGLLGGRVTFDSVPGSGTRLTADLPLPATAEGRISP